jgi:hypothetical protein
VRRATQSSRDHEPDPPTGERRALRAPREAGPLEVSPDVRVALLRMLVMDRRIAREEGRELAIDPAPILSLEAVDALEDHFRARLPDDALAIFCAPTDVLEGFALRRVGALTEKAWQHGLSKARIVLGELGARLVCIPRRPDRGYALRVTFFDPEDRSEGDSQTLASWLDRILEEAVEHSRPAAPESALDDATLEAGDLDELIDDPLLAIEREVAETEWAPHLERTLVRESHELARVRRVRHARFGEGLVLRAIPESDKLEIDFGPAGVRILVAKYVEELGPRE